MVQAEPNALTEFPPPSSLPVLMNFNTHRCLAAVFAVALSAAWTTQAEDAKVTHHYADNDGVKIHYATAGDSGPLVVIHIDDDGNLRAVLGVTGHLDSGHVFPLEGEHRFRAPETVDPPGDGPHFPGP